MGQLEPKEIHPSAARLYEAALELRDTRGKSAVARLLNVSPQMVNNWEGERGVSEKGALLAQRVIGCDANWVLTGDGQMLRTDWPFSPELRRRVAASSEIGRLSMELSLWGHLGDQPPKHIQDRWTSLRADFDRMMTPVHVTEVTATPQFDRKG